MAYQNVGTPRFYVDYGSWLKATGLFKDYSEAGMTWDNYGGGIDVFRNIIGLNPASQKVFSLNGTQQVCYYGISSGCFSEDSYLNYVAILGHNFNTSNCRNYIETYSSDDGTATLSATDIINYSSSVAPPEQDGFHIMGITNPNTSEGRHEGVRINLVPDGDTSYTDDIKIGAICYGRYYDMPHSPDMNLKMSIEMDGIQTIQGRGGATLSNATYTKPANWGDMGAWQLGSDEDGNPISNLRSGRRVWELSFSYLSDSSVMPANASTTNLSGSEADDFETDILDGTDFFSQVWNKTMGGHLPFIFQPDNTNNNPDQFAIARFDMNSLQYEQVANNVYNVKLKIRESW